MADNKAPEVKQEQKKDALKVVGSSGIGKYSNEDLAREAKLTGKTVEEIKKKLIEDAKARAELDKVGAMMVAKKQQIVK